MNEQQKAAKKIFDSVVRELGDWRNIRYMFDGFEAEDEAEFEQCVTEAIIRGLVEEDAE